MAVASFTAAAVVSGDAESSIITIPITTDVPASSHADGATLLWVGVMPGDPNSINDSGVTDTASTPAAPCFSTGNWYFQFPFGPWQQGGAVNGDLFSWVSLLGFELQAGVDSIRLPVTSGSTDWIGFARAYTGVRLDVNAADLLASAGEWWPTTTGAPPAQIPGNPFGQMGFTGDLTGYSGGFTWFDPNPDPPPTFTQSQMQTQFGWNSSPSGETVSNTFLTDDFTWEFLAADLAVYVVTAGPHGAAFSSSGGTSYGLTVTDLAWSDTNITTVLSIIEHEFPNSSSSPGEISPCYVSLFIGENVSPTGAGDLGMTWSVSADPDSADISTGRWWGAAVAALMAGLGPYCSGGLHIWQRI